MASPTTTPAREVVLRALRSSSELAGMQERVDELLPYAEQVRLAAGEVLFAAGDPALALYIVVDGVLQVLATAAGGRELVLSRLEAGAVLGEQAVVAAAPGRRPETVRAAQTSVLVRLGREAFRPGEAGDDPVQRRLREIGWGYARDRLAGDSAFAPLLGLEASARERAVGAGEVLFAQGDAADRIYLVVEGTAAVYKERGERRTLIGRVEAGRCVGELALIRRARRATTVVAETALRVLEVEGARFLDLLESEPQLREHMQALERVYHLPGRGVMTQHSGRVLGEDAITTLYHLTDGRRFAATRIVARDLYHLERVDPPATDVELELSAHGDCELAFDAAGTIARITSASAWPGLARAHMLAIDGVALSAAATEAFERVGELPPDARDGEILCSCVQVTEGAVDDAIRDGCSTTAALERALACATVCGGCLPRLAERVGEAAWTAVEVASEEQLTDAVRALRLRPASGALKPWHAGQHVIVGGRIEGHWIDRRYTITAAPGDSELEVMVNREPHGLLSNWLFVERSAHDRLRVSEPQGEPAWELGAEPALCFVAGIGVTPAIAACRALAGTPPDAPIHVDCSCRRATELPGVEELRGWNGATVDIRETATDGRLTAAEVRELVALHPGARVLVCGPPSYLRDVGLFLRTAGVPGDRIHLEVFTHAGAPIVPEGRRARPRPKRAPGEPDGSTDYERYLHTEELLALQVGPEDWAHPDELLFQTVHQASELWLKHAHAELVQAAAHLADGEVAPALRQLRRAAEGLRNVTESLDMLEQMSPWEYHEVRKALGQGSGFDSPGFRRIRDISPRLGAHFHALRETAGLSLLEVYTRGREHEELYQLAEHLVTWDERVTMWRMRHLKVVERIIGGSVVGTQGTPVEVLGKLIFTSFYPELWQVRNELTAHSNLDPLPLAADEPG